MDKDSSPVRAKENTSGAVAPSGLGFFPGLSRGFTLGYFLVTPLGFNSENHFLDFYSSVFLTDAKPVEQILEQENDMENIVAVAVDLENGEVRYFLTWGRIQDPVDPEALEQVILAQSSRFALGGKAVRARLCGSLQEAAKEAGFYECFFDMCQKRIPFGATTYPKWRARMDKQMRLGKEIYYLWHRP